MAESQFQDLGAELDVALVQVNVGQEEVGLCECRVMVQALLQQ